MGRTSKPLKIVALGGLEEWDEVKALAAQGHEVVSLPDHVDLEDADVILGPTCHRMDELHRPYLKLAIEEARRRRYPPKEEK